MQRPRLKSFILILSLIVVTGAAMAYTGRGTPATPQPPPANRLFGGRHPEPLRPPGPNPCAERLTWQSQSGTHAVGRYR